MQFVGERKRKKGLGLELTNHELSPVQLALAKAIATSSCSLPPCQQTITK
jgi:hypothetical protein